MPVMSKHDVNILFIHIPKTGGTTIEDVFRRSGFSVSYYEPRAKTKLGSPNKIRLCSPQHMHAYQINSIFDLSKFDYVFGVVRDPLTRAVSEYWMRNHPRPSSDPEVFDSWWRSALKKYPS